jgi:phosphoribosylglycinamide formyltransferase-1
MSGRLVVLVSGGGTNMLTLVRASRSGQLDGRVVGVLADRPCLALRLAAQEAVPTALCSPRAHATRAEWDAALRDLVMAYAPDLVVAAGFMRILGAAFVDSFEGRLINLHPSLLPAFPGAHAVRDALAAGVKVTGTTVHFVDQEVDHGPILMQEPVRVHEGDTEESLHERIKAVEHRVLVQACRFLLEERVAARG